MRKNTKMKNNQPWFIDALDRMVEEFYDQFENEMGEQLFMFLTEEMGRNKRTVFEAAEAINASIHGHSVNAIMDEEIESLPYDEFFQQNQDLAAQVMTRMIRRFADEY